MFRAAIGVEKENGSKKFVIRPYTPTSPKHAKGYFDLVVKVYEQGKMSKHFGELKVKSSYLLLRLLWAGGLANFISATHAICWHAIPFRTV